MFGEMALMRKGRRSATVVCSTLPLHGSQTDKDQGEESFCVVNEIKGQDFMRMQKHSESFLKSMNVILRTRMFRRAMLCLTAAGGDANHKEKMRAAFDTVDVDKSGCIDAKEVSEALASLESDLNEEDVAALLALADLDKDGSVCFEEFCRILQWENDGRVSDGASDSTSETKPE
eukprot:g11156.t3